MRRRPNGGHGGAGGNVIIEADSRIQNLANATHHFKGGAGLNGMRKYTFVSLKMEYIFG
jgi:GTPase involved in cell partitioning and DNA repair